MLTLTEMHCLNLLITQNLPYEALWSQLNIFYAEIESLDCGIIVRLYNEFEKSTPIIEVCCNEVYLETPNEIVL